MKHKTKQQESDCNKLSRAPFEKLSEILLDDQYIFNTIIGNKASGTFRMNINNLGCDTYLLKFTAIAE